MPDGFEKCEFMEKSRTADNGRISPGRKRNTAYKRVHSNLMEGAQYTWRGFPIQGKINNGMQDTSPGLTVIQLSREEDIQKIIRICKNCGYVLTWDEADTILNAIDANPGASIRIFNRNRVIRRQQGSFHTQAVHFHGVGPMGRTSTEGASVIIDKEPNPNEWLESYTMEAVIDENTFAGIQDRQKLSEVMGGGANGSKRNITLCHTASSPSLESAESRCQWT